MYHLHTLRHMSYVYLQIFLMRQGNTSTIEAIFLYSGCGRVVQGTGHKAKRLVLQCINGVSSNPVERRTKIGHLKDLILTLFGLIFRRIYIYIQIRICFGFFQFLAQLSFSDRKLSSVHPSVCCTLQISKMAVLVSD